MPFIASGTYGCVFKPHLKCKNKKNYTSTVGKVFEKDSAFTDEINIQYIIQKIDPEYKFTLPLIGTCTTDATFRESNAVQECPLINTSKNQEYQQMIIPYAGQSLENIFMRNQSSQVNFRKMFKIMKPLFEGLLKLEKHGIIHQDIKPDNIMFHKNKLFLIDFGIMTRRNKVYIKNNGMLVADYPYFPPEYKLYSKTYKSPSQFISSFLNNFMYTTFIGGHNVHLPEVIERYMGVSYEKELSDAFYKLHKNKEEYNKKEKKISVYQLGITLAIMFISSRLHVNLHKNPDNVLVKDLIVSMIHPNVFKRFTMRQAYSMYVSIQKHTQTYN